MLCVIQAIYPAKPAVSTLPSIREPVGLFRRVPHRFIPVYPTFCSDRPPVFEHPVLRASLISNTRNFLAFRLFSSYPEVPPTFDFLVLARVLGWSVPGCSMMGDGVCIPCAPRIRGRCPLCYLLFYCFGVRCIFLNQLCLL